MPSLRGFDPTTYNSTSGSDFTLGEEYTYQGKVYRFFQNANAAGDAATGDGDVCVWASTTTFVFTQARAGSSAIVGASYVACGVAVGIISKNNFGFLLVRGLHTNVKGVATTTATYPQEASGTAGSGRDLSVAEVVKSFGTALTGLTGGRYTVQVDC